MFDKHICRQSYDGNVLISHLFYHLIENVMTMTPPPKKNASAWLVDVPQRCWEPRPTLLDVCKAVSCCLSGKYSSDIHIFHSRVGSLLWRKSRHSNAERFAGYSESTCHVPRCLATAEIAFLSLPRCLYLVQWRAVSQTVADIKSQSCSWEADVHSQAIKYQKG